MHLRGLLLLVLAVMLLALLGCVIARPGGTNGRWSRHGDATATPLFVPELPTSSFIAADCGLSQPVAAWVDTDADGRREASEPPLARVEFFMVSTFAHGESWDHGLMATSATDGKAGLYQFIGGCDTISFDFTARPPAGYRATTAQPARLEGYGGGTPIQFGFVAAL